MSTQRIVSIKRAPIEDTKPKELYENAKWRIGATLSKQGGVTNTGLTTDQEDMIMPVILGMSKTDPDFRRAVKAYFADLAVSIPSGEIGKEFDISTNSDGYPNKPLEFIQYHFCTADPRVVVGKENTKNLAAMYYVEDKAAEQATNYELLKLRKEANKEFYKLTANPERLEMAYRVLTLQDYNATSAENAELQLETFVAEHPQRFIDAVKDNDLETRFLIADGIGYGILDQQGTAVLFNNDILGHTEREAVIHLKNKENSTLLLTLRTRVTQAKSQIKSETGLRAAQTRKQLEDEARTEAEVKTPRAPKTPKATLEEKAKEAELESLDLIDKGAK